MNTILKIDDIRLSKLNNAEYTNLMSRTYKQAQAATAEKLGVTNEILNEFVKNIMKMNDLVAQSHTSDDTARLAELDNERDNIIIYIIAEVDNKRRSPIAAVKQAAISLYNIIHVYKGIQNLPTQQETMQIGGLITDCNKGSNFELVEILGLEDVLTQLNTINNQYSAITEERTIANTNSKIENSKTVRAANDPIYDYIKTMAFVTSVATPSDEATQFIQHHNALIKEVNTLYNLRIADSKKPDKQPVDPPVTPETLAANA